MLQRAFLWTTVPVVFLLLCDLVGARLARKLLAVHVALAVCAAHAYVGARLFFARDVVHSQPDAPPPGACREFMHHGCKMMHYAPPAAAVRRLLVFPGLGVSVRAMLGTPCMRPFLVDSEICCFQPRGIGASDYAVDFTCESMLDDAVHALGAFVEATDGHLPASFVGYSLGCFVSMQLLSNLPWRFPAFECRRILLVNGMYRCDAMCAKFKALSRLLNVTVEPLVDGSRVGVVIVHARDDRTISIKESAQLKSRCDRVGRQADFLVCEGGHAKYTLTKEAQAHLRRSI
tara:strand:- start:3721 stop:4587 length:867 start_codon:yes stop_codon:yes gene_type:complete